MQQSAEATALALAYFEKRRRREAIEQYLQRKTPYADLTLGFWMKTSPAFAAYRTDERLAELLRASGLPQ